MLTPESVTPARKFSSNLQVIFGLGTALFIGVVSIVIVALQSGRTTVAPTAPDSQPQAAEFTSNTCTLSFTAIDDSISDEVACKKVAFQDEFDNTPGFYSLRKIIQTVKAGQQLVWTIEVTNTSTEEKDFVLTDFLPNNSMSLVDTDCMQNTQANDGVTVTCLIEDVLPGKTARRHIRARLNDSLPLNTQVKNIARIESHSASCEATVTIAQVSDQKQCNQACESDKECSESAGHICYQTNDGYFCRLATDPNSPTCSGPTPTPGATTSPTATPTSTPTSTPTNVPTPGATSTPTPSPLASCNASCIRNADCANVDHICVEISGQRLCRLASNVNSSSCSPTAPVVTATVTPTATAQAVQPGLPEAGNESRSTLIILAAGVIVLVLGSIAFLLLM